jgi:hypothetical protein
MRRALLSVLASSIVLGCSDPGTSDAPPSPSSGAPGTPPGDAVDASVAAVVDAGGAVPSSDAGAVVAPADASGALDAAGHPMAPHGYYVEGNAIYDATGQPHRFHGVDRTSVEWNAQGQYVSPSDYATMAEWKANVVRIPLDQDFWLAASPIHDPGYAGVIDAQIAAAHAAGLDVILDLHWSDKGAIASASASTLGTLPGQQRMADVSSVALWKEVAARYAGDGRVVFELYNEPHDVSWDVWLHGGDTGANGAGGATFTAVGMQDLYDAVRGTGAKNLVLVGGLDWAYDLSGVPSHRVQGFNVAYVSHVYHHDTGHDAADWPASWGFLAATDPIVLTEFGPFSNQGSEVNCGLDYVTALLDYADSKPNVSWTSWAWWVDTANGADQGSDYCDYPSLLQDRSGTPNALGQIVRARLGTY